MPEEGEKDDDRNRNAEQPKQNAATHEPPNIVYRANRISDLAVAEFWQGLQTVFGSARENEASIVARWLKIVITDGHQFGAYPEEAADRNHCNQLVIRGNDEVVDLSNRIFVQVHNITS